jgi:hypothetical protein
MSNPVQDETLNEEDELHTYSTDVYYISRRRDGEIFGKIELNHNEHLLITPARIPQPRVLTEEQIERKVSPRQITIQTHSWTESLSGNKEINHERFQRSVQIKGTGCGVFVITKKEFGEIIFAAQLGHIICAKWIPYYYKSGEAKGRYCVLTYFIEVDIANTIPNWKLYCVGNELIIPENSHYDFQSNSHRIENFYRISKVEQPPVENCVAIVKKIQQSTKVEYNY